MPSRRPPEGTAAFLAAIGAEVRRNRAKRGMTRRQLAQASETSERYLAQIEGGPAIPRPSCCARSPSDRSDRSACCRTRRAPGGVRRHILDLLARAPESELPPIAKMIRRAARRRMPTAAAASPWSGCAGPANRRSGGARRSSRLSVHRTQPRRRAGLRCQRAALIEMSGLNTFRRYERAASSG